MPNPYPNRGGTIFPGSPSSSSLLLFESKLNECNSNHARSMLSVTWQRENGKHVWLAGSNCERVYDLSGWKRKGSKGKAKESQRKAKEEQKEKQGEAKEQQRKSKGKANEKQTTSKEQRTAKQSKSPAKAKDKQKERQGKAKENKC